MPNFSIDESRFSLAPKSPKGRHVVGDHSAKAINSGDKSQITELACVSAGGHCLPRGIGSLSALSLLMVRFLVHYIVCQKNNGWIMKFSMFHSTIILKVCVSYQSTFATNGWPFTAVSF